MKSTGRFTHKLRKLVHYSYDHCAECNSLLPKCEPAYAGYAADLREIYVGNCCLSKIDELASHIYWWWTSYTRPTRETTLWRYMDFSKFVAMLKDGGLYFARADQLGDPFEGARGQSTRFPQWKEHCLEYFREAIRTVPGNVHELPPERIEKEAERLFLEFETLGKQEVQRTYVSCWHANESESEALWRLYAPPPSIGVALCTTFGQLDAAMVQDRDVKFGHVQYVDFAKSFAGTYDRIFWKRASLRHEAEVRAVIVEDIAKEAREVGTLVPVDLVNAFKGIVISPFAPIWFDNVLRDTMNRYGVDIPIMESSLSAEPFF